MYEGWKAVLKMVRREEGESMKSNRGEVKTSSTWDYDVMSDNFTGNH